MTLQGITEDDIANYLVNTPAFFERHAQLLASIQLTSPHGQRAVSLQERQMEMLRDKARGLERKIMELIRHSQENEAIAERLHRWVHGVLLHHDDSTLAEAMLASLQHAFLIPQAAVRVWGNAEHRVREGLGELTALLPVSDDAKSFAGSLSLPYCGVNAGFEAAKWLPDAGTVTSLRPAGAGLARPDALHGRHGCGIPPAGGGCGGGGAGAVVALNLAVHIHH